MNKRRLHEHKVRGFTTRCQKQTGQVAFHKVKPGKFLCSDVDVIKKAAVDMLVYSITGAESVTAASELNLTTWRVQLSNKEISPYFLL